MKTKEKKTTTEKKAIGILKIKKNEQKKIVRHQF